MTNSDPSSGDNTPFQEIHDLLGMYDEVDKLVAKLLCQPEEDTWDIMRMMLLALYSRTSSQDASPLKTAVGYLYSLCRFVESNQRFPSKMEQGELLEASFSTQLGLIDPVEKALKRASKSPRAKRIRRQQQKARKVMVME